VAELTAAKLAINGNFTLTGIFVDEPLSSKEGGIKGVVVLELLLTSI
jgi:hypothetical protein